MVKGVKYKFNICNLQKDYSLYERGMKPYILSYKAKEKIDRDWKQDGESIIYEKKPSKSLTLLTQIIKELIEADSEIFNSYNAKNQMYYKLSFEYNTIYDNDTVQIAYSVPYTFTDLRSYLDIRKKKYANQKFYTEGRLCMSLGGLPIPLITIHEEGIYSSED